MRKIRSMIGMPVVCRGKRIGRMIQADISEDLRHLSGIWIDTGLKGTRYIPSEDLEMIGEVALLTDSSGRRKRLTSAPMLYRAVSTDGQRLGAVTGVEIDEITFAVEAVELSCGVADDIAEGRMRIRNFTASPETGGVIIDPAGKESEVRAYERRHDKGTYHGNAHRRFGSDAVRRDELADREEVEPTGAPHGQLDDPQGG